MIRDVKESPFSTAKNYEGRRKGAVCVCVDCRATGWRYSNTKFEGSKEAWGLVEGAYLISQPCMNPSTSHPIPTVQAAALFCVAYSHSKAASSLQAAGSRTPSCPRVSLHQITRSIDPVVRFSLVVTHAAFPSKCLNLHVSRRPVACNRMIVG